MSFDLTFSISKISNLLKMHQDRLNFSSIKSLGSSKAFNNPAIRKLLNSCMAFGFPAVINLLGLVVFTRVLTLENYGLLSLALISVELLQSVVFSWVKMAMIVMHPVNQAARLRVTR